MTSSSTIAADPTTAKIPAEWARALAKRLGRKPAVRISPCGPALAAARREDALRRWHELRAAAAAAVAAATAKTKPAEHHTGRERKKSERTAIKKPDRNSKRKNRGSDETILFASENFLFVDPIKLKVNKPREHVRYGH